MMEEDTHGRRRRHAGRKEHILHTRISDDLAEDIRRLADDLRVPASNLVRNVLEEAFSVVETVTDNVGEFVDEVVEEAARARARMRHRRSRSGLRRRPVSDPAVDAPERAEFPEVVGWQPLILNRTQSCADCEESLERGEEAFVGLGATGLTPTYLCSDCTEVRQR